MQFPAIVPHSDSRCSLTVSCEDRAGCLRSNPSMRFVGLAMLLSFVGMSTGCQRWPGTQAMRQYQIESDRLVSEFRAQKKRADDLEARNVQLEQRLAESEKQFARSQNPSSNRLAGRNRSDIDSQAKPNIADNYSTRNSPSANARRTGLRDAMATTPGQLASRSGNADESNDRELARPTDLRGDPTQSTQWRPIRNR